MKTEKALQLPVTTREQSEATRRGPNASLDSVNGAKPSFDGAQSAESRQVDLLVPSTKGQGSREEILDPLPPVHVTAEERARVEEMSNRLRAYFSRPVSEKTHQYAMEPFLRR